MSDKTSLFKALAPSLAMALGLARAGCASTPAPSRQMTSAKVAIQEADEAGSQTRPLPGLPQSL
jgi:hypothetical protein